MYESEQEQVEAIRKWWHENGRTVIFGLVLGVGAVFGWTTWQGYVKAKQERASVVYSQLVNSAPPASEEIRQRARALLEEMPDSGYAALTALVLADRAFQRGDRGETRRLLQWTLDKASQPELRKVARLRLARLSLDEKDYDGALALLDDPAAGAFGAAFAEQRGDVLLARGDSDGAREAYSRALARMSADSRARQRVQLKLEDLGAGTGATAQEPSQ